MLIRILGSAAGGGFPQWNCACPNCRSVRAGNPNFKPRTQAQLAISEDGVRWYLLGASPDLRMQIEATPSLQPRAETRGSPITGVILLSAELDHVLGLLSLREKQPLEIFATASVRQIVSGENSFFRMLEREEKQSCWKGIQPDMRMRLKNAGGKESGASCETMSLGERFPFYANAGARGGLNSSEAALGLVMTSANGKRAMYAPGLGAVTPKLLELFAACDLLLLDGTFWADDELRRVAGKGALAQEMGHLRVGGPNGLIDQLQEIRSPRKILTHINNTNPILNSASDEYREAIAAGWEVAEDGWEFAL